MLPASSSYAKLNRIKRRISLLLLKRHPRVYAALVLARGLRHREKELELLPYLCRSTDSSIDIGANIGLYTSQMLRYSRSVYAFEPNADLVGVLNARFVESVRSGTLTIAHAAVGDVAMNVYLEIPDGQTGLAYVLDMDSIGSVGVDARAVEQVRLDDIALSGVGFIKIDVEGYEKKVLEGAVRTLAEWQPNLLIECEPRGANRTSTSLKEIVKFLSNLSYEGYYYRHGRLWPIDQFRAVPGGEIGRTVSNATINNFIFLSHRARDLDPVLKQMCVEVCEPYGLKSK